ncbi:hypothetical protein Tco_0255143 [Tanacetum coccineum]
MHHSMCSSTSNLVFMALVLLLWAIPLVVPLIPTFIANSLLTCHNDPLVVNSIGISRTPTVTGDGLDPHMVSYPPDPAVYDPAVWRSSVSSLFTSSSRIPSIPGVPSQDSRSDFMLSSTFSGGGDDEGSVAANSVMHASADEVGDVEADLSVSNASVLSVRGQDHLSVQYKDGQQDPPQGPLYPFPDWSQQCDLVIGL